MINKPHRNAKRFWSAYRSKLKIKGGGEKSKGYVTNNPFLVGFFFNKKTFVLKVLIFKDLLGLKLLSISGFLLRVHKSLCSADLNEKLF